MRSLLLRVPTTLASCLLATSALGQVPAAPAPAAPAPATALQALLAIPGPAGSSIDVPVVGKLAMKLYGFVELGGTFDSTQSFNESAGNGLIQREDTYRGTHPRFTFSVRDTRLGLRIKTEPRPGVTVSGCVELDFFGNQPSDITEAQTFTSPTMRLRQAFVKIESPYVDVLLGETWQLFGWQPAYFPNSVQVQGLPGQSFGRSPQLRLSHTFQSAAVNLEVAVAAARSPERDSAVPDGHAGIRMVVNQWKGLRTVNSTGTSIDGLSLGISGALRRIAVPELVESSLVQRAVTGYGISFDALIPVIPATEKARGNSLTLNGSFLAGRAISDLLANLTGGVSFPALAARADGTTPPAFVSGIDNGLVTYDAAGQLQGVVWQAALVGAQYYLPPSGRVWIPGNYSHVASSNLASLAPRGIKQSDFADASVFVDATSDLRFGLEYAWFNQLSVDAVSSTNHRAQLGAFYLF